MFPQVPGLHKSFTTLATPVSVVVCVKSDDVLIQVRLTREPVRTEGTAVRPLPRVGPCVSAEIRPCNEPGRAHLAPVRLHTIVGLHMSGVSRRLVNLRPAGGGCLNTPPLRFFADSKKTAARSAAGFSPTLSPIFLATFVKVSILGHARSGHQVRSSDHTLQKVYNRASATVFEEKL